MQIILAIETATEACSAALLISDGETENIYSRFQLAPREHTKLILPMLEEVLAEANIQLKDVDAIAFGRGPGAFTGLRIAAGIAQGVALSVGKPVIPISTLAALALQTNRKENDGKTIIAGLDARMDEVYWGEFKLSSGEITAINEEQVSKAEAMLENCSQSVTIGIGSAWDAYEQRLFPEKGPSDLSPDIEIIYNAFPSAEDIARLALRQLKLENTVAVADAQPVYLRNKVAEKSKKNNT